MTGDLFTEHTHTAGAFAPLADRMRPRTLDEVIGQEHAVGPGSMLRGALASGQIPSIILWGPPGSGKTTIARLIAHSSRSHFEAFSAVLSGVKEIRAIIEQAKVRLASSGERSILFVDEIHRFNKSQQDSFLPHVESGTIILIGATTENPSFEVNAALLSRCRVITLQQLKEEDLRKIVERTLKDEEHGLGKTPVVFSKEALDFIVGTSDGDARRAINSVEIISSFELPAVDGVRQADLEDAKRALQSKSIIYDKAGEEHYNVISAFIKSLRGSDPDAALYYLARMVEAGEDPVFIARRMVVLASEDIGNADLRALPLAVATMQAVHMIGWPEARINLAHCATYLACAPKSNASYMGLEAAAAEVKETGALPVPLHIRNAPTRLMKDLGYHKGYQYDHDHEDHHSGQSFLPDELLGRRYYHPSGQGNEESIRARLEWLRARAKKEDR
jgi:putative ATPase